MEPGSGGTSGSSTSGIGGHGGGAVRICATGSVCVNGRITADSSTTTAPHASGGSGGSIFITASTTTGSGSLTANGSTARWGDSGNSFQGGGGRIAVVYDPGAQGTLPVPTLRIATDSGTSGGLFNYLPGDIGTIYFPDIRLFNSPTNRYTGQWISDKPIAISMENWTMSNVWSRLPGSSVTVAQTLSLKGDNWRRSKLELTDENPASLACNRIEINGATLSLGGSDVPCPVYAQQFEDWHLGKEITKGPTLTVNQDLVLTNGGRFYVFAGLTHAGTGPGYGAHVVIGRNLVTYDNAWICPVSHPTNGTVPLFSMENLKIHPDSGFNADNLGYGGANRMINDYGKLPAYGPGGRPVYWNGGSGHGGRGAPNAGSGGAIYGDLNAPLLPGSGARCSGHWYSLSHAPFGGGSVQLRVRNTVTLQGHILANVTRCTDNHNGRGQTYQGGGGSSGGSINIICRTFIGYTTGILQATADQTDSKARHGGGGGRIAVWRVHDKSLGIVSESVLGGIGYEINGEPGTIAWGWLPPTATTLLIR